MRTFLRSHAAVATLVALLACQLAGLPAVSVGAVGLSGVEGAAMARCTCVHGSHANCPMHHPANHHGSSSNSAHWCAGAMGGSAFVVATTIFTPGVLPVSTPLPIPNAQRQPLAGFTPALADLFSPPLLPPPRV
jgi:hypothetical protein